MFQIMKERKKAFCYSFILVIIIIILTVWYESGNYGVYTPERLNYDVEANTVLPKDCFDKLLSFSTIEMKQCPRFALLQMLPMKEVKLSSQDLMVIYLHIGFNEETRNRFCQELKQNNLIAISYNWQTEVFSLGLDN